MTTTPASKPASTSVECQRFPTLPFSERRLLLMVEDLLAVNAALLVALAMRGLYGPAAPAKPLQPGWFLLLSLLWLPAAQAFDAYNLRVAGCFSTAAQAVAKAGALVAVLYLVIPFITPALPDSRLTMLAFPLLVVVFLLVGRGFYTLVLGQRFQRRTLIVGAGWAGRTIAEALAGQGDSAYELVGFVDDDPLKLGRPVLLPARNGEAPLAVLGGRRDLPGLIRRFGITTLVLAITRDADGPLLQELLDCLELGVDIIPMPLLYEQLTGRVPVMHVGNSWEVALPIDHPGTGALWPAAKRAVDILLALVALASFGLLLPLLALAIRIDSPGPIFYSQARVGKGGRLFKVYKLRSMVVDAEKDGAVWAQENDARVTRVGRWLRRTHVDELPQLWNILIGEMSAVGPRPERPEFVADLAEKIPLYRIRHAVKPGAAGWALVKQGYGASAEDALLKLQYDLYYIKHQSPWLDTVILLRTAMAMLTFDGR